MSNTPKPPKTCPPTPLACHKLRRTTADQPPALKTAQEKRNQCDFRMVEPTNEKTKIGVLLLIGTTHLRLQKPISSLKHTLSNLTNMFFAYLHANLGLWTVLHLNHSKEEAATAETNVIWVPDPSLDDEAFAVALCAQLDSTTLSLQINAAGSNFFLIPPCLLENATQLAEIHLSGVAVPDFRLFPSSLTKVQLFYSQLSPALGPSAAPTESSPSATPTESSPSAVPTESSPSATPTESSPSAVPIESPSAAPTESPSAAPSPLGTGFNPDGTLAWDELWQLFPVSTIFYFENCHLTGSLPTTIPYIVDEFSVNSNQLTGSVPPTIFSTKTNLAANSMKLLARGNQLEGILPGDLFAAASVNSNIKVFNLDLTLNYLSGPFPTNLFAPISNALFVQIDLTNNHINGPLSDTMFPANMMDYSAELLAVSLVANPIGGTIPPLLFYNYTPGPSFRFQVTSAGLTGELPPVLFPSGYYATAGNYFDLAFTSNSLTGTIPEGWLSSTFSATSDLYSFKLDIQSNGLHGPLPEDLLYRVVPAKRELNLPRTSQDTSTSLADDSSLVRDSSEADSTSNAQAVYYITVESELTILLGNNQLSGQLPPTFLQNVANGPGAQISVYLALNDFNGSIPETWQTFTLSTLDLSSNLELSGTIPPFLLNETGMRSFSAGNTALSGSIPKLGVNMFVLDLRATEVDFCASAAYLANYNHECYLFDTNACDCPTSFAMCQLGCPTPTTVPTVPMEAPTSVPTSEPTSNPTTSPISSPSPISPPTTGSCPAATRPSLEFLCINGSWTAQSITAARLSVAANAGNIVIAGNLSSTRLEFGGLGTTIVVNGCANNLSSVSVDLDKSDAEKLDDTRVRQTLVNVVGSASGPTPCSTLNNVMLSSSVKSGGCKKVKNVKEVSNDGKTLSAFFTLDASGCNTWWIILVSVIVAVIVIGVIIVVLLGVFYSPFRRKFRPYEQSNGRMTSL